MKPLYEIDDQMLQFIAQRLTQGTMDYQTAMQVNVVTTHLQAQANSPENQARRKGVAPAEPKSPEQGAEKKE